MTGPTAADGAVPHGAASHGAVPHGAVPHEPGAQTATDIAGQVEAWVAVNRTLAARTDDLRRAWKGLDVDHVHFSGCGSVNYLSQTAAPLLRRAAAVPTSSSPGAAFLRPDARPVAAPARTLLVATSRSGETSEMLRAVDAFRAAGGRAVWCVTTRSGSALAGRADLVLADDAGFEPSVVQTRSFSSLLALVQGLVTIVTDGALPDDDRLAAAGAACLDAARRTVDGLDSLDRFRRVVVLGSDLGHGLAQEGQLLMNEMALTDSAAHQLLDFRHGPISMVDADTLAVALVDADASDQELAVLDDVAALGATVLTVTMGRPGPDGHPTIAVDPGGLGQLVLLMPPLQLLAHRRAVGRAIDPDRPRHLSAVVVLDGDS